MTALTLRRCGSAAALLLFSAPARAQIVEVELRDANSTRIQRKYFLEVGGKRVLRGEPVEALEADGEARSASRKTRPSASS